MFLCYLSSSFLSIFFFFNAPPTTEIYPLSLHDALPIFCTACSRARLSPRRCRRRARGRRALRRHRSEEHTSELQSLTNLVCRLLLEKKKLHFRCGGNRA